jgi:hypothetical protein
MSLADTLATRRSNVGCGMRKVLASLPPKDRDALLAALDDPSYSGAVLSRMLREEGVMVSDFTIRRHRRTDCSCYRGAK